jgi:nucleotide-binding universal stress UspA family protein
MYKKILVPLDGSKRAESILSNVEELSRCLGSYVIFMQVLEPTATMVSPYDMVPYYDSGEMERRSKEASVYLAGLAGEFREKGIQAESVVVQGPVVRSILDVANEKNVGLIAMASHGRSGLARVFYGSVAAGILQQTDRPLLIVRAEGD